MSETSIGFRQNALNLSFNEDLPMLGWKEVNRGRGQIVGYGQSCHSPEGLVLIAGRGACPVGPRFFPRHVGNRRVLHRGNNIFLEDHRNGMEGVRAVVFFLLLSNLQSESSVFTNQKNSFIVPIPLGSLPKLIPESSDHFRNPFFVLIPKEGSTDEQ